MSNKAKRMAIEFIIGVAGVTTMIVGAVNNDVLLYYAGMTVGFVIVGLNTKIGM